VNEILALEAALGFIQREGLDQRFARHARIAAAFRTGLRALGWQIPQR
jgi:aspartate aminotransferase-like enzyme